MLAKPHFIQSTVSAVYICQENLVTATNFWDVCEKIC